MLLDILKSKLHSRSVVTVLIALNISIWLVTAILRILLVLFNIDLNLYLSFLELPSDLTVFAHTPWTIITYSFLHSGFFHLLFNMLALHWFGHMAEEHFSAKQILAIYLLGAVAGGLLFLASFNFLPFFVQRFSHTYLLGASAAVLAITTASAVALPKRRIRLLFIGDFSLKWFALFMIIVSFLGVTGSNAGGDIAHLGGAFLGLLYAYIERLISRRLNIFTSRRRTSSTFSSSKADFHFQRGTRSSSDDTFATSDNNPANDDIDQILDKIKRTGYASLTEDEKQRLFRR